MSFFNRLWEKAFFCNVSPLIELGSRRPLQEEDLLPLPELIDPRLEVIPESQIQWTDGSSLLRSLIGSGWRMWAPQLFFYTSFALMNLLGPVLINLFVGRISIGFDAPSAMLEAVALGLFVGLVGIIGGLSVQHYFYHHLLRFQVVTNILNKKIFSHALGLQKSARDRTPIGDIVNHMSADTDAVAEVGNAVLDLYYCLLMLTGAMALLFYYLGSTTWVAILLLSLLAPLTRWAGRRFTKYDEELMSWRDQRVTLMSQVLSAIRVVKYFVWEKSVAEEIQAVRKKELRARDRLARAEMVVTLLYVSLGTVVLFAVLMVHSSLGHVLTPALIFTCVSLFSILEDPFSFISRAISQFISGQVAAERITKFLSEASTDHSADQEFMEAQASEASAAIGVELKAVSFTYTDPTGEMQKVALKRLNFRIEPGAAVAIVGPVGAGKSTLIHLLLREFAVQEGDLSFFNQGGASQAHFRLGYVSQEAFILSGSVRENLTFGNSELSDADFHQALRLAAMETDLQQVPGGLSAEIGEKGINLSGGQRQRLSIARAVLQNPQMVILDDPLSAVDSRTEQKLAQGLIFGHWSGITRIVVTHRLTHLDQFDQVLFLEKGELVDFGSPKELKKRSQRFRSFLEEDSTPKEASENSLDTFLPLKQQTSGEALRVTVEEDRQLGSVQSKMYWTYLSALTGHLGLKKIVLALALMLAAAANTALPLLQKSWLAYASDGGFTTSTILVYGLIGLLVIGGTLLADLFWLKRGLKAGQEIHDRMQNSVLGAKIRFFDSTPIGRVLQRFSRDVEAVEIHLRWSFEHSVKCFTQVLITLLMIVVLLPLAIAFLLPIFYFYYRLQKLYRSSAREAKRMDSISRSPRYAHFKETLTGLVPIRASGKTAWFMEEFYQRLSHSQRMFYGHYMINRWFSSRIPVIGGLVTMVTTLMIVYSVKQGHLSSGAAGLLTVYSLSFWGVLNWGIRIWSEVEARMTSLERIQNFSQLPQEVAQEVLAGDQKPRTGGAIESDWLHWPKAGRVEFRNVHARYSEEMQLVLRGVSFLAEAGSRVGIIGRTGSGKSTIFQALYRFIAVEEGQIFIDGVDISKLPLPQLRRALAIIPQDPALFLGSLRSNLDRYAEHSDKKIWRALDQTAMTAFVKSLPAGLETQLTENGANFSQGQRQLLCLTRALLMKSKVIILDEATASVDVETDAIIQKVLRENCKGVTLLIIAHRLGTVQDCDQIVELSAGRVIRNKQKWVDQPELLGQRENSLA